MLPNSLVYPSHANPKEQVQQSKVSMELKTKPNDK
jgi:hypothetical protein